MTSTTDSTSSFDKPLVMKSMSQYKSVPLFRLQLPVVDYFHQKLDSQNFESDLKFIQFDNIETAFI